MGGNISSLGIGSGVLTADVIDQLKEADKAATITPIESKITLNKQKQEAYSLLNSLMKTFRTSTTAMSENLIFENKKVSSGDNLGVSIAKGSNVGSFALETTTLAKKDITKLGALDSKTTTVATGAGVLKISNADSDFEIAYTAATTLEELTQAITDKAGESVSASILKTADGAYNLVISSKNTGADEALTITDTLDGDGGAGSLKATLFNPYNATTNPTGYKKVQDSSDAKFKYNGIETTRPTNNIDDLVYGLSLTLKKEGDSTNVEITNDYTSLLDEMKLFTDGYNTLMSNLKDTTTKNEEKGTQGVFIDNTFIRSIGRDLTKTITASDSNGNSISNYGISIDKTGKMSFDKTVLETKLREDPEAVKLFFSGGVDSKGVEKTGMFETINEKVENYTASGKLLSNFETSLKTEAKSLEKNRTNAQKTLEARYDTMSAKFAAYDSMISKIESQFSSLKAMIDAEANSDD